MRLDDLYLWYLADPTMPRYVGVLNLVSAGKGVSRRDIESLADRIDGTKLLTQRRGFDKSQFHSKSIKKNTSSPFRCF